MGLQDKVRQRIAQASEHPGCAAAEAAAGGGCGGLVMEDAETEKLLAYFYMTNCFEKEAGSKYVCQIPFKVSSPSAPLLPFLSLSTPPFLPLTHDALLTGYD